MRRKDIRKRKGIRYAEYYNMVEIQDELYRQGMMKKKFYHLMPIIASPQNIRLAYRNLKNNKGSNTPGVDGKTFADYAKLEDVELIRKVQEKLLNYQPKAVRRVYIPKSNGKLRPLGIPTVLDRLVQQSILQVLEPVCESKFHRYSYGFRPNRSCKQAVAMCYKLAQVNGYHYVVDVDIKGFFDHVNHGKLLKQLWSLGIRDKSLLCVISRMLKAPVEENGKRTIPQEGTPQGGVLSPLLANIVLNELDWWIHSQWAGIPIHNPSPSEIWRTGPDGMNILICDDERFAAEKIAEMVSRSAVQHHLAVSVVKYTDVEKCLASPLNRCDIAFFDIDMKPYNGIDLARKLHNENPNAIIIFVTNYIEYAPAGYEVNAFRYLLKPEMDKNFERIFEDSLEAYKKNHQIVSFSIDAEHIEVPVHNILYLESEQRIMQMHLLQSVRACHRFYASMTQMAAELEPMGFLRIQKSYLVNMEYIESLKYGETRLKGGIVLKSSEKNHPEIKQRYSLWRAKNRWNIV